MDPSHRIIISLVVTCLVFFILPPGGLKAPFIATLLWCVFALSYIVLSWIVFFTRPRKEIIQKANKDDGNPFIVLISISIACFASMFAVLLLMLSGFSSSEHKLLSLSIAAIAMMLSWVLVHTLFTFHYAHLYYAGYEAKNKLHPDLSFPGDIEPDYLDFAYFSFVIGMTFQVSDVEINAQHIRRTALLHGMLSFALNTFEVALTINLIAGLRK